MTTPSGTRGWPRAARLAGGSAALVALAACLHPQNPPEGPPPPRPVAADETPPAPVAIVHATILVGNGTRIEDGTVVLRDGKILAVGDRTTKVPSDANTVDAAGRYVTPGIIDTHSHLGVYASPGTIASDDGNELSGPVTAEVDAEHSFWPQDPAIGRAIAGGVTTMLVIPGSGNLVGGRGVVIKNRSARSAAAMRFPGSRTMLKMACGENPKRVYGREKKQAPGTRMGNVAGFRQAFAGARDYLRKWDKWERDGRKKREPPPERSLRNETLGEVLRGNIWVQNHCYRADEMLLMLDVADEFGFTIRSFHHALEAYKIRDVLAKRQVGVSTWADWWGFKMEAFDGIPENLALVHAAGGRAIVHSDSADGMQRLGQEAGKALASGRAMGLKISDDDALKWVTSNPAWALGIDDRTGTLEAGKMADVVLWSADPLSVYARAERVWIDGHPVFDRAQGLPRSDFELGTTSGRTDLPAAPISLAGDMVDVTAANAERQAREVALRALPADASAVLIDHARVVTGEGPVLDDGAVLLRGSLIAAVGASGSVEVPAGVRRVEGKGAWVTAGLVDAESAAGLLEVTLEPATRELGLDGGYDAVRAAFSAVDGLNPQSVVVPVTRIDGVTSVGLAPQGGLVSGRGALVNLDGGSVDDMIERNPTAMFLNWGDAGRGAAWGARGGLALRVRELFDDVRQYAKRRSDFERNQMRKVAASRLDLEALVPAVVDGKLPFVVRVQKSSDIQAVLRLASAEKLRVVLSGCEEGWMVAAEIARASVPCVVQALQDLPESFSALGSRLDNAALLAKAGVRIAISTRSVEPHNARTIRQEAGNAVANGLPWDEALRAVTRTPADVLGAGDRMGTLTPGKLANVVVWSGDPFETSTRVRHLFIRGREIPLRSRQTELRDRYRDIGALRPRP